MTLKPPPRPKTHRATPTIITRRDPGFNRQVLRFDAGDDGKTPDDKTKADMALAKAVGHILHSEYPDYPWGVIANNFSGIVQIMLPVFTDFSWVLHINNLTSAGEMRRKVKHAGGAFLECYDVPRSGFSMQEFFSAMQKAQIIGRKQIHPEKL